MADKKRAYLYLLLTFFGWGSLYVVSKFVLGKIPVITIAFLRYVVAGSVLAIMLKQRKLTKIQKQDYKYIFLIGFLGYFVAIALQLLGTKLSSASLSSLVNSTNPIVIMLLAVVILKEKLTAKKEVCSLLAMVGVYIIVGGAGEGGQTLGVIISTASVIIWSWVSVMVRKITQKYDVLQVTTYGMITAIFCTLPFTVWELSVTPDVNFDTGAILSILYIGLISTAMSHFLWNKSLSMLEAGTCSLFYPLQPLIAVLLGCVFLGESISFNFMLGAVLIIGGVIFSMLEKPEIRRAELRKSS
jgi:drug/metabolite transporter (DMT)-like permease